jgi:ankyrin repeat protein
MESGIIFLTVFVVLLTSCWSEQQTQLLICAVDNDVECVREYLEKGEEVNGHGKEGMSPFYGAIKNHNFDVADIFIEHGVDLNGKVSGKSYLALLIMEKNYEAIEYLFNKGATFATDSGEYEMAVNSKNDRIISFFMKQNRDRGKN